MQDHDTLPSGPQGYSKLLREIEGISTDHVPIVRDPDTGNPEADTSGMRITTGDGREGVWRLVQSGAGASGQELNRDEDVESEHASQHTGNGSCCVSRESSPCVPTDPFSYASSVAGEGEKGNETGHNLASAIGALNDCEPVIDMEGCLATMRAFKHGAEPGIRRLRMVISNVFKEHGVFDLSMQEEALSQLKLIPIKVRTSSNDSELKPTPIPMKVSISFMLTEDEMSPVWKKPNHSRGDDSGDGGRWGEVADSRSKKLKRQLCQADEEVCPLLTRLSHPSMPRALTPLLRPSGVYVNQPRYQCVEPRA